MTTPVTLSAEDLIEIFGSAEKDVIALFKKTYAEAPQVEKAVAIDTHNLTVSKEDCLKMCKKINYVYQEGDESRIFQMVLSSESVDRMGDIVKYDGGIFDDYWPNPVIMPFHNTRTYPIGQMLEIETDKPNTRVLGTLLIVQNSVDPTGTSEIFYKMLKAGLLRAGSINFLPTETIQLSDEEKSKNGQPWYGYTFSKWKLLEYTICSIPANQDCLQAGLDKGLFTVEDLKKCLAGDSDRFPKAWLEPIAKQLEIPIQIQEATELKEPDYIVKIMKKMEGMEDTIATLKSGAVLSKTNVALVKAALDSLGKLEDAVEALGVEIENVETALTTLLTAAGATTTPDEEGTEENPANPKSLPGSQSESWIESLGAALVNETP